MNRSARIGLFGLMLSLGAACSSSKSPQASVCGLTQDSQGDLQILASAENDYTFWSKLTLGVDSIAPRSELTFDWSGVTKSMLGQAMDPKADVGVVTFLLWNLTKEQFETQLNDDAIDQNALVAVASMETQGVATSGTLSDLTEFGQPIDHNVMLGYLDATTYDPATHIYTVMVASGTQPGKNTKMLKAARLDPAETNNAITVDSNSTELQFKADLHSLVPVGVPVGTPKLAIDWTGMDGKTNAMDHPFITTKITHALVASYTQPVAELESGFLGLQTIANGLWESDVESGTSIGLSSFKDKDGNSFPGIDDSHTWIVALECGTCNNPAPWYISILTPCPG